MKPLKPILSFPTALPVVLVLTLSLFVVQRASAATVYWVGTNGVSADTNWSDTANFANNFPSGPTGTPNNNEVQFNYNTTVQVPGLVTVNVDNGYGGSGIPQAWDMSFVYTNGYQTLLIQPGVQLTLQASAGTPGGGFYIAPANYNAAGSGGGNAVATGPYTNHVVMWGTNASFSVNGPLFLDAEATSSEPHYSMLDMSGLDNFIWNNSTAGSTAESFLIAAGGRQRSQALVYLAKTNVLNNGSDVSIGYVGNTYSNSQPSGLYLGISNSIVTGHGGNGNELQLGLEGCVAGAFLKFNPAFLGGATKPTAYLSGSGSSGGFPTVSGMMGGAVIGRSDGASVPSTGTVDFTGGIVTWNVGQIQLGRGGTFSATTTNTATGVLSFDSGTITANDVWCGWQQTSFASSGAPGVGIINVGSNATLQVNNVLRLGLVTGTQAPGTAGSLNVNGGTVILNLVTNTSAATGDLIALTNATVAVPLNQVGITNIPVTTLSLGGATNILNITSITPELGSTYPVRFHVINYKNLVGTLNVGLGTLPATYNPSYPYSGYVDTTTPGFVDLVLTAGPPAARILTWSGLSGGSSNGTWDVATTADWLTNGVATVYNQYDLVNFSDSAATGGGATNINMTTALTPYALAFSNSVLAYTLGGSGNISGSVALLKSGTNSLLLDDSGGNNFSGGMLISAGTVQVGNGDNYGNLGSGAVTNNGTLLFDHGAQANVANIIAGSGNIIQEGGDTLALSGASTYTGTTLATNGSTLQAGSSTAFGASSGNVIVASGSSLDFHGNGLGAKPIVISGAGPGGTSGAIVDSGGAVYDSGNNNAGGGLTSSLTLAADSTIYLGANRCDLATAGTLSTSGKPYNLTLANSANNLYMMEWRNLVVDTNLANITITSGGLGIAGSTQLGNPTNSLIVPSGCEVTFWNTSFNVNVNKQFIVDDGAVIANSGGANVMSGSLVLTNANGSGYCSFNAGGTSLTINSVISGNGILYEQQNGSQTPSTIVLSGNSPAFTGGVLNYVGTLVLNGSVGCGVTNLSGASLMGTGTATGSMDIGGGITPGSATAAGTLTVGGGLVLEGGANFTNNLTTATTVGGGINSLIQITGNLSPNGNTLWINPLAPLAQGSTYTVITYTGALSSAMFSGAATTTPSGYTFNVVNVTGSPNKIQVVVTSSPTPALLSWNDASGNNEWDVAVTANWSNLTTQASSDYFYNFDPVLLLDSITNAANPGTNIDIASGVVVVPAGITNNSTVNYTISGAGKISGTASLTKLGTSALTISTKNDFSGSSTIAGGTLVLGSTSALGTNTGTTFITNGGTLDLGGFTVGAKPIVVSGAGVNGNGAIVNNGSSAVYDNGSGLTQITLATNATFGGGVNRWDLGGDSGGVLSSGGKAYNLTLVGTGYTEWNNVATDTNLANIIVSSGTLGVKGTTQLGNPTNAVNVASNAALVFYLNTDQGINVALNKAVLLHDGATLQNGQGTNILLGAVTLSTNASGGSGLCTLNVNSTSLSLSNAITGPGTLIKTGGAPLILGGVNTYTGATIINAGAVDLVGSIATTPLIVLLPSTTLDVSGRTDDTLTLVSGQTLEGYGTVNGDLTVNSGATVEAGTNDVIGTLTVTNVATLNGTTTMALTAPSSSSELKTASVNYGGTLNLVFTTGTLAAGNSFKLFNATAGYSGTFASISPATPGTGLQWNTNQLATSGTLLVASAAAASPPVINSVRLLNGNLVFSGTNGTPSGSYALQVATNLTLAPNLVQWQSVSTNSFDSNGNFSLSIATTRPDQYFRIKLLP